MQTFESRDGSHWTHFARYRPLANLTPFQITGYIAYHLLILPLALVVLLLTWAMAPVVIVVGYLSRKAGFYRPTLNKKLPPHPASLGVVPNFLHDEQNPANPLLPQVSIVIPFFNRAGGIEYCLRQIFQQRLPENLRVEVIAVDNNSTDNTAQVLAEYPVRLINCAQPGPAAARNAGIQSAQGGIIAFIDSDCVPDLHWLERLVAPFSDPEILITGGQIDTVAHDNGVATFTHRYELLSNQRFFSASAYFPPFFATANAAYRRDAILQVGGFDPTLRTGEDADLAWRVLDLGGKIAYIPEAVVFHAHRESLRELYRQASEYGAGSVAVFARHKNRLDARYSISWRNIRDIAYTPIALIARPFYEEKDFDKKAELYYALWRAAFTLSTIRESIRRRTLFV